MRSYRLAPLCCLLAACVTAEKRFEQAQSYEAEGRHLQAAQTYLDALRRDPEYPGAREGLRRTGSRVIQDHLEAVSALEADGRFAQAAEVYRKIDELNDRAISVRVVLSRPEDYKIRKRATYRRALEQLVEEAERAAAADRFEDAVAGFKRALRYQPTAEERERIEAGMHDALLGAARAEVEAGHYRHAYELVQAALKVHGTDSEKSAEARELRDRIVKLGTVRVAPLPVWREDAVSAQVPAGLLGEINDILEDEGWDDPPLFLAVVEPGAVRRELRRLDFGRQILSPVRSAAVARTLDAAFAVVTYLDGCAYDALEVPQERVVATRDGRGAVVHLYSRRTLQLGCAFRIVDAAKGEVVSEGRVEVARERDLEHAVLTRGWLRDLVLTRQQHAWFDARALSDVDREVESEAVRALAAELAGKAFQAISGQLP